MDLAINHAAFLQTMIVTQFELEDYFNKKIEHYITSDNVSKNPEEIKNALKLAYKRTHEVDSTIKLLEIGCIIEEDLDLLNFFIKNSEVDILVELPTRYSKIWSKIENYLKEFAWMGRTYYSGEALGELELVLRIKNLLSQKNCKEKLQLINEKHSHDTDSVKKYLNLFHANFHNIQRLQKLISFYLFLRTYRLYAFFIAHENVIQLFLEIAKRTGYNYEEILLMNIKELLNNINLSDSRKSLSNNVINRKKGVSVIVLNQVANWDYKSIEPKLENENVDSPTTIKGVIANKGYAEGYAKVILGKHNLHEMEKGDVLVTTMTMPNLMLAVEKASAIVTDEGGMLCHAAIVSRELNIPCIIDTEVATRILSTGERVIVDANNGIVKRI